MSNKPEIAVKIDDIDSVGLLEPITLEKGYDLETLKRENGLYIVNTPSNAPSQDEWFFCQAYAKNKNMMLLELSSISTSNNKKWTRVLKDEIWGEWSELGSNNSQPPPSSSEQCREVEMQKGETHIQWRYVGDSEWRNLISIEELKGDKGEPADTSQFYTKQEIDEKEGRLAEKTHTHAKSDISDFPTSLPANGGNADTVGGVNPSEFARISGIYEEFVSGAIGVLDTRDVNQSPSWYFKNKGRRIVNEFKNCAKLGLQNDAGMYCMVQTTVPWDDTSGGKINQIAYRSGKTPMIRFSEGEEIWGEWQPLGGNTGSVVKSIQRGVTIVSGGEDKKIINLSQIDASKSFVILNGDYYLSSTTSAPYVKTLDNDKLVIANSYGVTSNSYINISWQVIEFN